MPNGCIPRYWSLQPLRNAACASNAARRQRSSRVNNVRSRRPTRAQSMRQNKLSADPPSTCRTQENLGQQSCVRQAGSSCHGTKTPQQLSRVPIRFLPKAASALTACSSGRISTRVAPSSTTHGYFTPAVSSPPRISCSLASSARASHRSQRASTHVRSHSGGASTCQAIPKVSTPQLQRQLAGVRSCSGMGSRHD